MIVFTGEYDFMRRDNLKWAARCKKLGKLLEFSDIPGSPHGLDGEHESSWVWDYFYNQKRVAMDIWCRGKKVYKLHYFPVYARGEPIRMLLTHAGVDYEDHVITFEDWSNWKEKMPNGVMPAIETTDGKKMDETCAILRSLGMKYGYYPTDPMKAWECDAIIDGYMDIIAKTFAPLLASETEKEGLIKELFEKIMPKFLGVCEQRLQGKTYLCGD